MPVLQGPTHAKQLAQQRIRRGRSRLELARLEYQRTLKYEAGTLTQKEIASAASISQPSVSEALEKARKVDEPREGFSGGSLREIFLRYSADEMPKEQLIDELSRWEYDELSTADSLDGLLADLPNTFHEVEDALINGIIEADVYNTVLEHIRNKN